MITLQTGAAGPEVQVLQTWLAALNPNPAAFCSAEPASTLPMSFASAKFTRGMATPYAARCDAIDASSASKSPESGSWTTGSIPSDSQASRAVSAARTRGLVNAAATNAATHISP